MMYDPVKENNMMEQVPLEEALALLPNTPLLHTMTMHTNWPRVGKNIGGKDEEQVAAGIDKLQG